MSFPMISMGGGPGRGLFPGSLKATCKATEAIAAGTLVVLDRDDANSKSLTYEPGDGSIWQAVRVPVAADLFGGIFGIATAAIAEDAEGEVVFSGIVDDVDVQATTAAGDMLMVNAAGELELLAAADTGKIVGIATTAVSGGTSTVWFDGITGFGFYEAD